MMSEIQSSQRAYFDSLKSRDFKCPCGKSYLSYAALFTHIKQKHQGKPPGKISKPGPPNLKRGRPSLKTKTLNQDINQVKKQEENNDENFGIENQSQCFNQGRTRDQNNKKAIQNIINDIAFLINQFPDQKINKEQINEIQAFTEMIVIIHKYNNNKIQNSDKQMIVSEGLIQFLKQVSEKVDWNKFQQLYILFMLFLQFIMDQQNNQNVLKTVSMDILCEHINQFYQNHLQAMAQYYSVDGMFILREDINVSVFNILFKWMMLKKYTSYEISLGSKMKKCVDANFQQI